MPTSLPTGMVTFLFAGLDEASARWDAGSEAEQAALERFQALVRQPIVASKGVIFQSSGAAISSAFVSPRAALEAALGIQRAILAQEWGELSPPGVRIALHQEYADLFGERYSNLALSRVTRLLAFSAAGQILLSPPTQAALQNQLPPGVQLADCGEHLFPGLLKPMRIFQATSADLPGAALPVATQGRRRSNLPEQPTRFIGRQAEVFSCCDRLLQEDLRLLTLKGPGGAGKTRLSQQIGAELLGRDYFPDGVYVVFLADISDPQLIPSAIARAIEVPEQPGTPLLKTLKEFLAQRQLLLILDNFEHVTEAAPMVAELLEATSQLTLLVTSQTLLGIPGEQQFEVPPLAVPDARALPPLAELARYEAVRFFVACAQLHKPEFELSESYAPVVAEICQRVDGLPLAIELAAARLRHISPVALLQRLGSSLALLQDSAAGRPARQQTMRNVFSWSYELLDPAEQQLFRRLGVFVGGCGYAAVEAVCAMAGEPPEQTAALVASLIDKSLLRQQADANDQPRLSQQGMLREYAISCMEEQGELAALRERHAAYYLQLIEQSEAQSGGAQQGAWLQQLEQEHGNIRALLEWAQEHGQIGHGLRVAAGIWKFWQLHGHISEGRRWMTYLLEQSAGSSYPSRARALWGAGWLAMIEGTVEDARRIFEEGVAFSRALGDGHSTGLSLHGVGAILRNQGRYDEAISAFEASLTLFEQSGDVEHIAWTYQHLGFIALIQQDSQRAARWLEQGLAIFRQLEQPWAIAEMLFLRGKALVSQGLIEEGTARLTEGRELYQQLGDNGGLAKVDLFLGYTAMIAGDFARASQLCQGSLSRFHQAGNNQWWLVYPLEYLGDSAAAQGQFERAALLWGAANAVRALVSALKVLEEYPGHQEYMRQAQAALGAEACAAAEARGLAMSVDQVLGYLQTP